MTSTKFDPRTLGQEQEGVFILPTTREKEINRNNWRDGLVKRQKERERQQKEKKKK